MPSDVITNVKTIVYYCPPRLKAESCHLVIAPYALFPANKLSLYESVTAWAMQGITLIKKTFEERRRVEPVHHVIDGPTSQDGDPGFRIKIL